jgi:hypothetical protein
VKESIQELKDKFALQGAMDAVNTSNALEKTNAMMQKQNVFFRHAYGEGYISAAKDYYMAEHRDKLAVLIKKSASEGINHEQYDEQVSNLNAYTSSALSKYTPFLSDKTRKNILQELHQTALNSRQIFQKQSAQMAIGKANAEQDKRLNGLINAFVQNFESGEIPAATMEFTHGLEAIQHSEFMSDKDKNSKLLQFVTAATTTNNLEMINHAIQITNDVMGPMASLDMQKSMVANYKQAALRNQAASTFQVLGAIDDIQDVSDTTERKNAIHSLMNTLETGVNSMRISAGTATSAYKQLKKIQSSTTSHNALEQGIKYGASFHTILGASSGASEESLKSTIRNMFPKTLQGSMGLYTWAQNSRDPIIMDMALKQMGEMVSTSMNNLDLLAKDGVYDSNAISIMDAAITLYKQEKNNPMGQQQLLSGLPVTIAAAFRQVAVSEGNNLGGDLLKNVSRVMQNQAMDIYSSIPDKLPEKMKDKLTDRFINPGIDWLAFGAEAKTQRNERLKAINAHFTYLRNNNPEALMNTEETVINTINYAVDSSRLSFNVLGKSLVTYLAPGVTIDNFKSGYQGSQDILWDTLNKGIEKYIVGQVHADSIDSIEFSTPVGGYRGGMLTALVFRKGEMDPKQVPINFEALLEIAQINSEKHIGKTMKDGSKFAGLTPVTFTDVNNKRNISTSVSGSNSVKMDPVVFGDIMSKFMEFEGFKGIRSSTHKGNDTVGFGFSSTSGIPLPESISVNDAIDMLREILESKYVPAARKKAKEYGIELDDNNMYAVLDAAYHGGFKGLDGILSIMKAYKDSNYIAYSLLMDSLHTLPTYKESQSRRKQAIENSLSAWGADKRLANLVNYYAQRTATDISDKIQNTALDTQ